MLPRGPWQYAEFVDPSPSAAQPPFVLCDGAIDDVRFAPVDAVFTAAVYDPSRLLVQSTMHTNGEVLRCVRDERQRVVAEIGPGGQVAHFDGWTFARDAMSDGLKSNTMLSVTAAGGGTYRDSLPLRPAGTAVTLFAARPPVTGFDVAGLGWCARFEVLWSANDGGTGDGNPTVLRLGWGAVRLDISYTSYDLSVNGAAVAGQVAPALPGLLADVMVMAVGGTVLVFQGNQLVFSQSVTGGSGPVTLTMQGRGLDLGRVDEVYLLRDPIVAAVISDGLGREIQRSTQDDGAAGSVVSATFYDGWGRPAVRTMPVHAQPASFAWRPDLFTGYDWATGRLSGGVQAFYNGAGQVPSQLGDDASFAATRSLAEASPLARPAEIAPPGSAYAPGRPAVTSWAYGPAVPDAALLAQDLGLSPAGAFGFATAYLPTAAGPDRVPEVRVFDRQGNTIATRRRSDVGKLTTGHAADRASDGTLRLTTLTPNHYLNPGMSGYTTVTTTDFTGRATSVQDTDTGLTQMIYDRGGRLRFLLDADGAAQTPPRMTYRRYDSAGRPVEDGWISTTWDRAHLQAVADTQPGWPGDDVLNAGPPGHPSGQWSTRQHWDIVPGTASSARLKGRLAQVAAQDENGHQVVETYAFDAYGRTSSVTLLVQSFDAIARITAYRYNLAGDVTQITYPAADGTPTGPGVTYGYDSLGRPATIGTSGAPSLYAAYDYTFDGKVRTEWLGGRSIRGDIGYDFQGRRLSASYQLNGAALFAETLEFSDTSGADPVAVTAHGGISEAPYKYAIGYDPQARLGSAQTIPDPGSEITAHPEWDVAGQAGPIGYDGNGNIASLGHGPSSYRYDYDAGTDKLAALVPANGGPAGNYRWDASGRLAGSPAISEIAYRPASALPSRITTQKGTTVFRYSGTRRRALKATQGAEPQGKLYVHGAGADPLLEQRGGTSTQYVHGPGGLVAAVRDGTVYAVVRDALGSTRALVPPGAGDSSTLRFNYLPFGELMPGNAAPPEASPIPYLFTGRELDTESGLYDFRARLHDPVTGRFTAPDPAGEFASPYVYVGNDPFGRTDPSGQLSLGAYRFLIGAATFAVYGAIGAGIGAGIGALANPQDRLRGAQEGAWIGAAVGAGLGLLRGIGEHVVRPLWRNLAAEAAAAGGGTFPVVAYNATQWTSGFQSGRLGAELIAEAEGIPRSLRNTHLVNFQDLHAGGALHAPAGFNGRVIAVAHGPQGVAEVEVGLAHLGGGRADAGEFVDLFHRAPMHAQPAYSYAGVGGINRLDLCVCYPRSNGFSAALRAEFNGRAGWALTTGWAAAGATTPAGAWAAHGVIREAGNLPSEMLHWLVPFYRSGTPMPVGVPPAGVVAAAPLGWGPI
jgi:RHS repeat-associated protein